MSSQEFSGVITNVQASSSYVKVQLESVPGKVFAWRMTQFLGKPKPEVGMRIILTARPGRLDDYEVASLTTITDEPKQAISTEIQQPVGTEVGKFISTEIATAPALTIEQLAEKILKLKAQWKDRFASEMLDFKWTIGHEIFVARVQQDSATYRKLGEQVGIDYSELARCVQFFEKYPSHGYELKAWRKVIAELPAGKEPTAESKPALVIDDKHLWTCPECGVKFQHLHAANGKHRLREVEALKS